MIYSGDTQLSKAYIGTTQVLKVYQGNTQLYSAYTWDSDALSLINRMSTQPSDALKVLINDTITSLKTAGVWNKLDCLYFRNVHTSQAACLNWVRDAHNSTLVNSPTFIAKQGIRCAAGKYIRNDYKPSIDGSNFQIRNSSVLFLNYQLNTIYAAYEMFGDASSPANRIYLTNYLTSTRYYYCNSSSYAPIGILEANKVYGAGVQTDVGSDYIYTYVDGIQYAAPRYATQSASTPNLDFLESYGTNATRSFSMLASKLTPEEHLAVSDIVHYFCDNVAATF